MKTIAICNLKGGVAKTTTAVNLAADLAADRGKRVLLIDADSQANATRFCGADPEKPGMYELLTGTTSQESPAELQPAAFDERVRVIAGNEKLMDLDLTKAGSGAVDTKCLVGLRAILDREAAANRTMERPWKLIFGEPFDYCLIDCPPAFNAASAAALLAADTVLIPIKLDAFALEGMANLLQQIRNMRRINPGLQLLGVLPVMWYRSDETVKAESALRNAGLRVLPRIRRSSRVDDMTFAQRPLITFAPRCSAARDYRLLAARLDLQLSAKPAEAAEPLRAHDVDAERKERGDGLPRRCAPRNDRTGERGADSRPCGKDGKEAAGHGG